MKKSALLSVVATVFILVGSASAHEKGEVVKSGDWHLHLPLGLPADKFLIPQDNPMSKEKIELGKLLYFDKRLSIDDTLSCADCHDPKHGFTDNKPVSEGVGGTKGGRSAPTIINRAFTTTQMWDGRKASLEDQTTGPLTNPVEMKQPSDEAVVKKLAAIKGYAAKFKKVFGKEVNIEDYRKAVAAFERTVVSGNSKYDRFKAGNQKALNASEKNGLDLFEGKARCLSCHNGFNFSDEGYHNIGVGMSAENPDVGRSKISGKEDDKGAFKTPTLRDISATAPYMHDGSEKTLEDVVEFYDKGGVANPSLSPLIEKLGLTSGEQKDLVAFLKALDGEGWRNISAPKSFPK
ncbi:MAG: cytochrome-c peroxidase [Nitrospinae bacterium]|nr:cytochrome-c peroxidase [Nitrospinota bacterium]